MNKAITLFAVLLCNSVFEGADDVPITTAADPLGRFYLSARPGDGMNRCAHVLVYEHVSEQHSLRLIFEFKLLNKIRPQMMHLSPDGRFLVTLEDYAESGTSPLTLVIYDLVRREHTAYKGRDFLDPAVIEKLPSRPLFNGFSWFSVGAGFSPDSKQFYPTSPKYCERDSKPFVVVDLPSRTVSVKPLTPEPIVKLVPHQGIGWKRSSETVDTFHDLGMPLAIKRFSFTDEFKPVVFKFMDKNRYSEITSGTDSLEFH